MKTANVKNAKICAFCKKWYDPANTHIKPKNILGGFWEYDEKAKSICAVTGTPKRSNSGCNKFEIKV